MSDVEVSSDNENGEIRSDDENDLQVIEEQAEGEVFHETELPENVDDGTNPQKEEPKVKRLRNPQPKLNVDRLKGPRGVQTVEGILKKIKFKGRGHEEDDLNSLMRGYEYWCHRLFPKFTFDDCLDRIERLGTKREIQTHIKKIRMNLLLSDDINGTVPNDDDENETENPETQIPSTQDDPFNALLPLESETANVQDENVTSQAQTNKLSEDQLERIRINRERAQRIRMQTIISMRGTTQSDSNLCESETQESFDTPTITASDHSGSAVPEPSAGCNETEQRDNSEEITNSPDNNSCKAMEVDLVSNESLFPVVEDRNNSDVIEML
ncbi:hypothetical protein RI129_003707 [Pyrocoelia pectoralis]|uniref:TIMELESS-interacting protein n=1 Tax=Pyrocoelia pectoralis TaxID=417401 RepID=A0AAN7ZIU9_9COLE